MSLIAELGLSLKDSLPQARAHLINQDGRPAAVVSDQLYQKLNDYADKNQMSINTALERLRAEIHATR